MAGFNIESFKSEVTKRNGLMKPSRFLMTFVPPPLIRSQIVQTNVNGAIVNNTAGLSEDNINIGRSIEYWCEGVTLPGYQLMMGDTRRWTYGPHEKRPFGPNTVSLQAVFLSDGNGDMITFFHSWLNNIVPHSVTGSFDSPAFNANQMFPYEVRYKQEYATDIHIYVYHEAGDETLHYTIREAFPSQVVDIPLSWEATNSALKFQVTFEYLDWYMEKKTIRTPTPFTP